MAEKRLWTNLFPMVCYILEELDHFEESSIATKSGSATEILATLLTAELEKLLAHGLLKLYQPQDELLTSPRGRVDVLKSLETAEYQRGRLYCLVDQLDVCNQYQTIIFQALELLLSQAGRASVFPNELWISLQLQCQNFSFCKGLPRTDLDEIPGELPYPQYRTVLALCHLIMQSQMPLSHQAGGVELWSLQDEYRCGHLFEKFVRAFCIRELPGLTVSKRPLKHFPALNPDIILESTTEKRSSLIVDCKWYSQQSRQAKHSENYYQMNAYVTAYNHYENQGENLANGLVLYATQEKSQELSVAVVTDGTEAQVKFHGLDVTQEFEELKRELRRLILVR